MLFMSVCFPSDPWVYSENCSGPLKGLKEKRGESERERQMKLVQGGDGSFSAQGPPINHQ